MEPAIFICPSRGNKKMQVRVKIYPGPKRLYHGDNPGRKLSACNRLEVFQKCLFPAETELLDYLSAFGHAQAGLEFIARRGEV